MPGRALRTLTRYTYFPKELFRPQIGHLVQLRPVQAPDFPNGAEIDPAHQQRERLRRAKVEVEDLADGLVPPKGCALKPNSKFMRQWVINGWSKRPDARVWIVQEGTRLPDNLVLVQQGNTQQWSIDPVGKQSLTELNNNINNFLSKNAAVITASQWVKAYPKATEREMTIIDPRAERAPRSEVVKPLEAPSAHNVKYGPKLGVRY